MKVIFLIGVPGSGKSFFSSWLKRRWTCEVVSSDEEREHIAGCHFSASIKKCVLEAILEKCRTLVSSGRNVVLDSTYFNSLSNRHALYSRLAGYDVEFLAVEFPTEIGICVARDSMRCDARRVGADVIERLNRELELPTQDECVRVTSNDTSALFDILRIDSTRRLEVLAPSGNKEQLEAALGAGCDAVYGGLEKWNARGRAKNFSSAEYGDALGLCHKSGVKFYLTLNTLMRDDEIAAAVALFSSGELPLPDAFIVADVGLMMSLRVAFPSVPLHVSTQGGVATVEDARFYRKLGVSRLILARELNFAEIKKIHDASGLEIEVFVYGSQCVAFSGQCMWGALMHGCSGNRGCCIGMCRDAYEAHGQAGEYLYPRDLSAFDALQKLADCGVNSIKIEGRMRRAKEVADIVTAFCGNGDSGLLAKLGGNYDGFLGGVCPEGMFSAVNPRGGRSVKFRSYQPLGSNLANVSLKVICDDRGRLVGFDCVDDKGGRSSLGVSTADRVEGMTVAELADRIRQCHKVNVYEVTSNRAANESVFTSAAGLQSALETVCAACQPRMVQPSEHIDFSAGSCLCAVSSLTQLKLASEFGFNRFVMPWKGKMEMERALGLGRGFSVAWELPTVDFSHPLSEITSILNQYGQSVVVPRICQLGALGTDFSGEVILGMGGNVWNERTIEVLKAFHVSSAFLSPELPVDECASKLIGLGLVPIVHYWGRLPMAVSRGCFKSTGICNGTCCGHTAHLVNVGKGYDVDLFCDRFSNTRILVPEKMFFSGNDIGPARKCVSFRWMNDSEIERFIQLSAEGSLEGMQNIYLKERGKR